jgi:hypothetical protein
MQGKILNLKFEFSKIFEFSTLVNRYTFPET